MRAWHFSENAYPYLPPADTYPSIRVSLPNRIYDPVKGAALYDRYIDEWLVAEDEGVEIMLNEHHQTATCVDPGGTAGAGGAGAADQDRAAVDPGKSRRQPSPARARGRRDGHGGCALKKPAPMRVRAWRAL